MGERPRTGGVEEGGGLFSSFGLDPTLGARFRRIGPIFDASVADLTLGLFRETHYHGLPPGGRMIEHLSYGDHDRHRLDLCLPAGHAKGIVLFVPGGGFTSGDKALYRHVPAMLARQGYLGACMDYRLAPDFLFPSGAEDVVRAIDWLSDNAAGWFANGERLFLIAQSAGAVHAATALFDARFRARNHGAIRSAVLMSGIYSVTPDHPLGALNLYFGNDAETLKGRSPLDHVASGGTPVILTLAEFEPAPFGRAAAALMDRLTACDGRAPPLVWLRGHNHLSPVLNLGSARDRLGRAIVEAFEAL